MSYRLKNKIKVIKKNKPKNISNNIVIKRKSTKHNQQATKHKAELFNKAKKTRNNNKTRTLPKKIHKTVPVVRKPKVIGRNSISRPGIDSKKISGLRNIGKNRILVMIACGPSILEIDFKPLKKNDLIDIMVINKPVPSVWPPKFWAFCDHSQYERNRGQFKGFPNTIINSSAVRARHPNQVIIPAKHVTGVSRNLISGYVIGRSSVYANMQTALWMNYDKVFIFGVDMCAVNGKLHHYGTNPDVSENKRLERFKIEANNYLTMAKNLPDEIRKKFYFCSSYNPWSFTDKFNKWDHKKSIEKILKYASES